MADEGIEPGGESARQFPPCCYGHPSALATALCVSCGRAVCGECDRRAGYMHYCPECIPFVPVPPPYPYPLAPPFAMEPPEPQDEREKRWWRADWSMKEAFLAMLLIFGIYNAVSLVFFLATDDSLVSGSLCYMAVFCPLIVLCSWYLVHRHQRGWKELGYQWGKPGRTVLYGGLGSLAAIAFSYGTLLIIFLIYYVFSGRTPVTAESERIHSVGAGTLTLFIIVTVALAPVFEELLFRGLLYPALRRRLGPKLAILVNALIFGALHFQPLTMISLVLVGAVLAYLYEKTDSLVAPMLAHAFYNAVVIAITLLVR